MRLLTPDGKCNTCGTRVRQAREKLNLSQESVEMLLDIALEMSQKQKANYEKDDELKRNENIVNYEKNVNMKIYTLFEIKIKKIVLTKKQS